MFQLLLHTRLFYSRLFHPSINSKCSTISKQDQDFLLALTSCRIPSSAVAFLAQELNFGVKTSKEWLIHFIVFCYLNELHLRYYHVLFPCPRNFKCPEGAGCPLPPSCCMHAKVSWRISIINISTICYQCLHFLSGSRFFVYHIVRYVYI